MSEAATAYVLPATLTSRVDLSRMIRELDGVDAELLSQKIRNKGAAYVMPVMSQHLNDFVELNSLDLTDDKGRQDIKKQMAYFKDHAPIIHLTFAGAADSESMSQLVEWLRTNIHPQALVSVGLQPSLIGGVHIRTPDHIYDFSIRSQLQSKRGVIAADLEALKV